MTDYGQWPDLISDLQTENGRHYFLVPLDDYQLANLLGMMLRNRSNLGDYYWEIIAVICETIIQKKIRFINNYGDEIDEDFAEAARRGEIEFNND